jgi:hypothetical protein
MIDRDLVKPLHGPYVVPALRVGDRAACDFRGDVRETTPAPLSV